MSKIYPINLNAIKDAKALVVRCVDPRFAAGIREFLQDMDLWPAFQLPRIGGIVDLTSMRRMAVHGDALLLDVRAALDKVLDGRKLPFVDIQHQQCKGCGQGDCHDAKECLQLQTRLIGEARPVLYKQPWFAESMTSFQAHFFHLDGTVTDIVSPDNVVPISAAA